MENHPRFDLKALVSIHCPGCQRRYSPQNPPYLNESCNHYLCAYCISSAFYRYHTQPNVSLSCPGCPRARNEKAFTCNTDTTLESFLDKFFTVDYAYLSRIPPALRQNILPAPSVDGDQHQNISCRRCQKQFNVRNKPVVLACGIFSHTVCESCLIDDVDLGQPFQVTLTCEECKREDVRTFNEKRWVLPPKYFLRECYTVLYKNELIDEIIDKYEIKAQKAKNTERFTREQYRSFFCCPVCQNVFKQTIAALLCGHMICKKCLEIKYTEQLKSSTTLNPINIKELKQITIQCPTCSKPLICHRDKVDSPFALENFSLFYPQLGTDCQDTLKNYIYECYLNEPDSEVLELSKEDTKKCQCEKCKGDCNVRKRAPYLATCPHAIKTICLTCIEEQLKSNVESGDAAHQEARTVKSPECNCILATWTHEDGQLSSFHPLACFTINTL